LFFKGDFVRFAPLMSFRIERTTFMDNHETLKTFVKGIIQGYATSLFVQSRAGLGKTETVLNALKTHGLAEGVNYRYFANYATPKGIVELLQRVNQLSEPRILVLDDFEESLRSMQAVGVLRSALWEANGRRRIFWQTARERTVFDFTGRIIFLLNRLNLNSPIIQALASRGFYYTMDFSKAEILQMMREKAKVISPEVSYNQKMKLIGMLERLDESKLNLRLLPQAIALYQINPQKVAELINKL
jgi:hypothetical protein